MAEHDKPLTADELAHLWNRFQRYEGKSFDDFTLADLRFALVSAVALLATVDAYRQENAALRARIEALEIDLNCEQSRLSAEETQR
jgi:glutathione S-transferase